MTTKNVLFHCLVYFYIILIGSVPYLAGGILPVTLWASPIATLNYLKNIKVLTFLIYLFLNSIVSIFISGIVANTVLDIRV